MPEPTPPYQLPEGVADRNVLKLCIFNALTEDLSFHYQMKNALCAAGFEVTRIQKHWFHNVFEVTLTRSTETRDDSDNQLSGKIRRALKSESIDFDKSTFVLSVQGRRLICAFCFKLGGEGTILAS